MATKNDRLARKKVLITGAGKGYGAELAVGATANGAAAVIVHYNSSRGPDGTAAKVRELGSEANLVRGDVADWEQIKALVADSISQAGGIDVLVNCVADIASQQDSWRDITEGSIDHTLAVDIKGTMLMTHEVGLRMMDDANGGVIINIGWTVITLGSPRAPQYAASKYGVLGLTKPYAKAFAPKVRVNTFAPGFMATETRKQRKDWRSGRREELIAATPLGRIPGPEEFVDPVMFLASPEAAHLTGGLLIYDGGMAFPGA